MALQVQALHNKFGREEWSGSLLYRITAGSIDQPQDLVIVAEAVYPHNKGNSVYTEYDFNDHIVEMFERYPKADPAVTKNPWLIGQIHSHHSMSTFFSGTDLDDLKTNAEVNPGGYLSLIVNFDCDWKAKLGLVVEESSTSKIIWKYRLKKRNKQTKTVRDTSTRVLFTYDFEIKQMLDSWFFDRMKEIDKPAKSNFTPPPVTTSTPGGSAQKSIGFAQNAGGKETDVDKYIMPQALRALVRNKIPNFLLPNAGTKITHKNDVSLVYNTLMHLDKIFTEDPKVRDKYLERLTSEFEGWIWMEDEISEKYVMGTFDGDEKVAACVLDLLAVYKGMIPAAEAIYTCLKPIYEEIKESNEKDAKHVAETKAKNTAQAQANQETDEEEEYAKRMMHNYENDGYGVD